VIASLFDYFWGFVEHPLSHLRGLAPIGAAIVFFFGYRQYKRAESWKRTEYVAKQYKEFSDDLSCQTAMCILDGEDRKFFYENNKDEESYDFDNDVLGKALSSKKRKLSEPELHIRDSLDQFFVYIQRFERAIRNRLISQRDVYPYFGYWIGLLKNDGSIKKRMRPNARCAVIRHMVRSEFDDAGKFFFRRAWEEPDSLRMRICRLIGCGSIFDR